jgi:hypothetical protein
MKDSGAETVMILVGGLLPGPAGGNDDGRALVILFESCCRTWTP